ncbi:MAG: NfeD family protein [Gammaproteobacteria bacterium]
MWEIEWWHWAVLGFSLLVLDVMLLNIYYLLWFGAGAVGVSVALALFPATPAWAQIVLFAVSSAMLLALWLLVLRPRNSAKMMRDARRELPGMSGVVVNYNPREGRGAIRLQRPAGGRDVWDFSAETAKPGERATIESVNADGVVKLAPLPP